MNYLLSPPALEPSVLPIVEVGQPAFVQTTTGIQLVDRAGLMAAFEPSTIVEVSFDPGFFHPDPVRIQNDLYSAGPPHDRQ